MSKIAVVYYSGYGHTKVIAETFANEIQANLVQVDQEGNIAETDWDTLDTSDAIVFGAPTYMGGVPWQFKKFADASSKRWFTRAWSDKIFGGFTNSACVVDNCDFHKVIPFGLGHLNQYPGAWTSEYLPGS